MLHLTLPRRQLPSTVPLPWEIQSFTNSLPLTTDFNGGTQCSSKELCDFLNKSIHEQHFREPDYYADKAVSICSIFLTHSYGYI